ncbi:MAG TPA: TlpA disulfide reductase family protein [Myxococcota bacterium]
MSALAASCDDAASKGSAGSRFDTVKKSAGATLNGAAARNFCEKQWPVGEGGKKLAAIPERAIPGGPQAPASKPGAWRWVNLWATWCHPCVEEMALLGKWKSSLEKDGVPLNLELWSVDDDEKALTSWLGKTAMPGRVRWVRSLEDLPAILDNLGADKASAIPVHALIDGNGNLRCLRVGAVHDEDYGAIKAILSGA